MKKILMAFIALFTIVFLSSCNDNEEYTGEYPELYTMACNNLITKGFKSVDPSYEAADIFVLEQDSHGRILFAYVDCDPYVDDEKLARITFLICQAKDEEYVYYYPYYNFLTYTDAIYRNVTEDNIGVYYKTTLDSDRTDLKKWNDWDEPLDIGSCVKSRITNYYDDGFREYDYDFYDITFDRRTFGYVVCADEYGNQLLCVERNQGFTLQSVELFIVSKTGRILSRAGLSYHKVEKDYYFLFDSSNYTCQGELKKFKENNYWNIKSIDDV